MVEYEANLKKSWAYAGSQILYPYQVRVGPNYSYPKDAPKEVDGWRWWNYGGKGPRWPCWECRQLHRRLYSDLRDALPADPSYSVQQRNKQGNTISWQTFAYKWYCVDCLSVIGIIW